MTRDMDAPDWRDEDARWAAQQEATAAWIDRTATERVPATCPGCSGSGEGMADGTTCLLCGGDGTVWEESAP